MNTARSQLELHPTPIVTPASPFSPDSPRRFVVVMNAAVEEAPLAGRILEAAGGRHVLLVGAQLTFAHEPEVRRVMALLAAFLRSAGASVTVRMEPGPDWIRQLMAQLGPDDQLSCVLEDSTGPGGLPLHDLLSHALNRPVLVFTGAAAWEEAAKGMGRRLAPWLASLAVILGFLALQIALTRAENSTATNLLLWLTLPAEAALIWLCNALFP
jgi:hypothetical protein